MSERYRIKLMGTAPSADKKQVVMFATGLFKVSKEKAEAMLSKPCIVKKNVEKRQALAMKKKLESYGMVAAIIPMDSGASPAPAKSKASASRQSAQQVKSAQEAKPAQRAKPRPQVQASSSSSPKRTEPQTLTDKDLELLGVRPIERQPNHMLRATAAGFVAAIVGAFLWKWIALTFNVEHAMAAVVIGIAIGFVVVAAGGEGMPMAVITVCLVVFSIFLGKYWMYYEGIMTAREALLADETFAALAELGDKLDAMSGQPAKSQFRVAWDNVFSDFGAIDFIFIAVGGVTAFRIVNSDDE